MLIKRKRVFGCLEYKIHVPISGYNLDWEKLNSDIVLKKFGTTFFSLFINS